MTKAMEQMQAPKLPAAELRKLPVLAQMRRGARTATLLYEDNRPHDGNGHWFHVARRTELKSGVIHVWFPGYFGDWWKGVADANSSKLHCTRCNPVWNIYKTPTERVLVEMYKTSTGQALCDSGGELQDDGRVIQGYGRGWEIDQRRVFIDELPSTLHCSSFDRNGTRIAEISVTHNTFLWLRERVKYDPDLDWEFRNFCRRKDFKDEHWLGCAEGFVESQHEHGFGEPGNTVNTYNGETCLDETLQYVYWSATLHHMDYALLQLHRGCDVRGGYGRPRAFRILQDLDPADASLCCPACGATWDTDDAYNWYPSGKQQELKNYPALDLQGALPADEPAWRVLLEILQLINSSTGERLTALLKARDDLLDQLRLPGQLVIVDRHIALCPCCGHGRLRPC